MSDATADWNLVIAICVGLIALGHILDVVLYRDREAAKVRKTLEHWSDILRHTSLREWQIRIGTAGTSTLHRLHRTLAVYVGSYLG
jgi:hypothetical protein